MVDTGEQQVGLAPLQHFTISYLIGIDRCSVNLIHLHIRPLLHLTVAQRAGKGYGMALPRLGTGRRNHHDMAEMQGHGLQRLYAGGIDPIVVHKQNQRQACSNCLIHQLFCFRVIKCKGSTFLHTKTPQLRKKSSGDACKKICDATDSYCFFLYFCNLFYIIM